MKRKLDELSKIRDKLCQAAVCPKEQFKGML